MNFDDADYDVGSTIKNTKIYENGATGVYVSDSTVTISEKSEIFANGTDPDAGERDGIRVSDGGVADIIDSSIYANYDDGVEVSGIVSDAYLTNVTISANLDNGIFVDDRAYVQIYDSEIFGNADSGVHVKGSAFSATSVEISGTDIYNNVEAGVSALVP